ncbi:MAG: WbqC family protein [Bacteroidota bacterium]
MQPLILPLSYCPPIPWMQLAAGEEKALLETQETFPKQTIRNRCVICASGGMQILTVPLKERKNNSRTCDILIDQSSAWQKHHLKTLQSAYSKSPFFQFYSDDFSDVLNQEFTFLAELNFALLLLFKKMLRLKTEFDETTEYFQSDGANYDFRNAFDKKNPADYISLYPEVKYRQVFEEKNGFVPNVSVLDLLFNTGPDAYACLLKR